MSTMIFVRGHSKVCSLRKRGGEVIEKRTKTNRARGILSCVSVCFLKKNAEISKMKFYSSSPVFPIDYNGSRKY